MCIDVRSLYPSLRKERLQIIRELRQMVKNELCLPHEVRGLIKQKQKGLLEIRCALRRFRDALDN